jgi:flavin reductase (DIM6/NTAB) family NADH-FMN oxidoreductase RutF
MTVDHRAFRNALGCFATGVTVVTTIDGTGQPVGLTVSSFASLSLDPPLVLFCLDRGSQNFDAFTTSGRFAVNLLREDQRDLSTRFAMSQGDRFAGIAYDTWETGAPVLPGSLATLDCSTETIQDGGDHVILIGRVHRAVGDRAGNPLIYYAGAYRSLSLPDTDG